MAKMLDALERARQEREKKLNGIATEGAAAEAPAPDGVQPEPQAQAAPPAAGGELKERVSATSAFNSVRAPGSTTSSPRTGPSRLARGTDFHPDVSPLIVSAFDRQSPITEQLRQIRTNLETVLADYRSRSIVITSPTAGDGKTLVAANLAAILAERPDQQVLLVDADLRKGNQAHLFNTRVHPGLSEYLRELCTLEEATCSTSLPNLKVIPCGHPTDFSTVLLGSDRMTSLVGELQRTYRWIIFDTPPMLPVTDALVLGRGCVGLIMVVRMGQTSRQIIARAQDTLAEVRLPILGCILNDYTEKARENAVYYKSYRTEDRKGGFRA